MHERFVRWRGLAREGRRVTWRGMTDFVSVRDLRKTYDGGFEALKGVSLGIREGEILALLGPNGAGKTTLISTICGITRATSGKIEVGGHDNVSAYRAARSLIGLVPQEIALESFETVWSTVSMTRGLFGRPRDDAHIEKVLRQLSLWDKKDAMCLELSGGMKRRVLIAKALSHGPRVLFLDEPTAGVDVELRKSMWEVVEQLKADGVTIILTTHYIEEAEEIADRVAVIRSGEILLVEEKDALMRQMARKELRIELQKPLSALPAALQSDRVKLGADGSAIIYTYDTTGERTGITRLLGALSEEGIAMKDLSTHQSSLEDIFVGLVKAEDAA